MLEPTRHHGRLPTMTAPAAGSPPHSQTDRRPGGPTMSSHGVGLDWARGPPPRGAGRVLRGHAPGAAHHLRPASPSSTPSGSSGSTDPSSSCPTTSATPTPCASWRRSPHRSAASSSWLPRPTTSSPTAITRRSQHGVRAAPSRSTATGSAARTLELCHQLLGEGWSLLLYPEGGRSPDGEMREFKPGAAWIARRAGVPVLPGAPRRHRRRPAEGTSRARAGPTSPSPSATCSTSSRGRGRQGRSTAASRRRSAPSA